MKLAKRLLALCLVVVSLCAFLVPGAAAADSDADKIEAVMATARAYYHKGVLYQYGSREFTVQDRVAGGVGRLTTVRPPEFAAPDDQGYSVCSDFTFCVYYHALGYAIYGTPRKAITYNMATQSVSNPTTIYKFGKEGGETDFAKAYKEAWPMLQPGDIITEHTSAGHAMLYVGDCFGDGKKYVMHSTGASYNPETGVDSLEAKGTVRIDEAEEFLFKESGAYYLGKTGRFWSIIRPMNDPAMKDCKITDSARIRMKYDNMQITRYTNPNQYRSVRTGETIAVTTELHNNGKVDYKGLTLSDPLPIGGTVDAASISNGGKLDAKGVTWTLDVPAGETLNLTYNVKVTAKRTEEVQLPMSYVDNTLPVRNITLQVAGVPFSANNANKLSIIARMDGRFDANEWKNLSQGAFVNYFFKKYTGTELNLPETIGEMQLAMFDYVPANNMPSSGDGKLWHIKDESKIPAGYKDMYDMIIREHVMGQYVSTEPDPMVAPYGISVSNRVRTFYENSYEIGDIFIGYSKPDSRKITDLKNTFAFIYLGNGRVAAWDLNAGLTIKKFEDSMQLCLKDSFVLGLRPSLAFDDVNNAKATAKLGFTDVPAGAWYESYLKSLNRVGVISGMTETTFAPNGNLTYGQALKLIAKGLGYDDQAAVNGGHWASGYLKLAKEEQWLKEDVDLNANISRLAFCQIAAKSKGLARKSPADTFTDCSDTHVLRLHKAGVINGMTEKTFAPNAPLTRAQITKIIYLLNQV